LLVQVTPLPPIPTSPMDIAVSIAVVVGSVGVIAIGAMLARAVIKKWLHPTPVMAPDVAAELQELRHAVGQLSGDVSELHERLDFTERVLASQPDARKLEGGR
jgi:hypothetical protein